MNVKTQNFITYGKQIFSGIRQLRNFNLSSLRKVFSLMGKKEKKAILSLLGVAFVSLSVSSANFYYAHTLIAPANGGTYTEGLFGQPTYLNPLLAHSETDLSLIRLIYSGLYKYDDNGQLVPDLAEGMPQISEDQKQYTINLKPNVKWHNGKSFTADDVIFTIQTLKDPAYKSPLSSLWQSTDVEKLSDYSVKFTTKDISGPFLQNLALPIMSKSVWGTVEPQNFLLSKYNLEAIGTGPYAIKEIKKQASGKIEQITLNASGNYYGGRPKIDSLAFKFFDTEDELLNALHSKEIGGFGYTPSGSNLYLEKDQQDFRTFSIPLPQYQVIFFNLNNPILADLSVRQALAAATNRQQVITGVFKNNALFPASPLLPPGSAASSSPDSFNAEQAKQILDNAGWKVDSKTGLRAKKNAVLELTITTNDSLANSQAAEIVANQWRALNIKVNLSVLPNQSAEAAIHSRSFDVLLFPQKFGADPDPFLFWHSSQVKDPGFNLTGFANADADRLITEARTTTDNNIRKQKYEEFNNLITQQAPVIFLDQAMYVYAVDKRVKNINLQNFYEPNQRFYDLPNWYMDERRVWK
ncbi:MAG: peptide ABC transporter substrate-binding protein [Patescibacteria group bacterium]|nr:peptide ABC transporter substrate-binding protein [Patescibacteria group bacterium]